MEMWHERAAGIVSTEDMNRSKDGEHANEAESESGNARNGVWGDGDWVGSVVLLINCCHSYIDAAGAAVDNAL